MIYFLLVSIAWLLVQGVKPGISDNLLWIFHSFFFWLRSGSQVP